MKLGGIKASIYLEEKKLFCSEIKFTKGKKNRKYN